LRKLYFLFFIASHVSSAAVIKGVVVDKKTREPLIGATISVKELNVGASVSLSGTYKLSIAGKNTYTLVCRFLGYHTAEKTIVVSGNENIQVDFELEENSSELQEVVVTGVLDKTTDEFALHTEKNSQSIINVMSAKTIQLMPDITVANLLQRFSGVSVDRNSSGDAQYAIIRGMPQRYNYTLVNGIKIPSPDDKNRYVPMDLFPADLLDRLEVIKSLTPSMEGDATGGGMNLVMKDAPATFTINASAATGTNSIAVQRGFSTFSGWQEKSPAQIQGSNYIATPNDFSYKNFQYYNVAPVNQVYNFSIGDRLTKNKKLGAIFAGSYQNVYRATNSVFFKPENETAAGNIPTFDDILVRQYSNHQRRYGLHVKADYHFNDKNQLRLYAMYVGLDEVQRRHTIDTVLTIGRTGFGTGDTHILDRSKVQQQNIINLTLQGDHSLTRAFRVNWSAVYSKASNNIPDWSEYETDQYVSNGIVTKPQSLYSFKRIWETNTDQDYTGYLNLYYNKSLGENNLEISAGGLYRSKTRDNKYYYYDLTPLYVNAYPPLFQNGVDVLGPDTWIFNNGIGSDGNVVNANTYNSHERISAGYIQGKLFLTHKWEIIGGARVEHTYQDWLTPMPLTFPGAYGNKSYLDILPSLNVKYRVTPDENLRFAYFKSINRPGFFEIVPTNVPGDYFTEAGNPYLKHATIDNIDLRFEKFSKTLDQISLGVFYKYIVNPIEQLWDKDASTTSGTVIYPGNAPQPATNFGAEVALTKYWGRFGVSGNYTYTHSEITTTKFYTGTTSKSVVMQTRPLQGQSPHIANLSLLYKDVDRGLNLQLAMAYTGTRITFVSPFQNSDYWQQPLLTMDFSLEKSFMKYFSFYVKAQNLLNSPYQVFIHQPNIYTTGVNELPMQYDKSKILVQREYYGQNYIVGFRYKFSK
jgi:hypothetical protein